jgi:translation initiation factor IF-2
VTFLDTPGHEAFTAMRARGAKVGDVAVLVVAADDGVMPQTVEAIDHAKAAEVSIVVAVNKVDRPDANPDRVRRSSWPTGCSRGVGRPDHLRRRLGQAAHGPRHVARDAAAPGRRARAAGQSDAAASGPIIESRLDVGRGPVATMLVERGTLRTGDAIVAGDAWGKVRALQDYRGQKLDGPRPPCRSRSSASTSRRLP